MRISDWSSDVCSSDLKAETMCKPTSSSLREAPEWEVCRHLIRLLLELDNNTFEVFDDDGRLGFYSVFSHDQSPMNFLTDLGLLDGGGVRWRLIEPDFDRCADILLQFAPFDEVLSALVSTTIYNNLLSETPDPFELPLGVPSFGKPVTGPILDNLKSLMGELVKLGYARRANGQKGNGEAYL